MEAIKQIIECLGYESVDEMEVEDHHTISVEGYMDLVIEKIREDRLSVAHYYTQNGDLMSDPEIVFDVSRGRWTAVRYTQHPFLHEYDPTGLPDVEAFSSTWSSNLRNQGFVDEACGDQ
jgi:hypothetical protein